MKYSRARATFAAGAVSPSKVQCSRVFARTRLGGRAEQSRADGGGGVGADEDTTGGLAAADCQKRLAQSEDTGSIRIASHRSSSAVGNEHYN